MLVVYLLKHGFNFCLSSFRIEQVGNESCWSNSKHQRVYSPMHDLLLQIFPKKEYRYTWKMIRKITVNKFALKAGWVGWGLFHFNGSVWVGSRKLDPETTLCYTKVAWHVNCIVFHAWHGWMTVFPEKSILGPPPCGVQAEVRRGQVSFNGGEPGVQWPCTVHTVDVSPLVQCQRLLASWSENYDTSERL